MINSLQKRGGGGEGTKREAGGERGGVVVRKGERGVERKQ